MASYSVKYYQLLFTSPMNEFSFGIFWAEPTITLAFSAIFVGLISLWIRPTPWVWGTLAVLSGILGYISGLLHIYAIIPLALLFIFLLVLAHIEMEGVRRIIVLVAVVVLSFLLILHITPGFKSWLLYQPHEIKKGVRWYLETPFLGLFITTLYHPLLQSKKEWMRMIWQTIPIMFLQIVIIIYFAMSWGLIFPNVNFSLAFFPWVLGYLFCTVLPQEALFHGVIQKELERLPHNTINIALSIAIPTVCFICLQLFMQFSFLYLIILCLSGLGYSILYYLTKSIESSVICRMVLNSIYFIFFTYLPSINF